MALRQHAHACPMATMRDFLGPAPQQKNGSDCGRILTDMRRIIGLVGAGTEGPATESEDLLAGQQSTIRADTSVTTGGDGNPTSTGLECPNGRSATNTAPRPTPHAAGGTASERRGLHDRTASPKRTQNVSLPIPTKTPAALARLTPPPRAGAMPAQTDLACNKCPVEPKPIRKRRRTRPHPRSRRSVRMHRRRA